MQENQQKQVTDLIGNNQQVDDKIEITDTRVKYLRKLYFLLFVQLFAATWLSGLAEKNQGFGDWVKNNSAFTFWVCIILVIAIQLVVFFSRRTVSRSPTNWITYFIFVVLFAFLMAYWEVVRKNDSYVNYGLMAFTHIVLALFIHALYARATLTFQSASLYIFGATFAQLLFLQIFYPELTLLCTYVIGIFAILWGFYLVWENETVVGSKVEWSKEDCAVGAVGVYLSIFTLILGLADLIRQLIVKARS